MNLPIGSIISYAGSPRYLDGDWRVCDGEPLVSSDYPKLYQAIGTSWGGNGLPLFHLPDLRGKFLRGVDRSHGGLPSPTPHDPDRDIRIAPPHATGGNSGNEVGSYQKAGTAQPVNRFQIGNSGQHHHNDPTWNGLPGPYELATTARGPGGYDYGAASALTTPAGDHTHQLLGGDSETRPVNCYVYFIIRVK